MPKIAAKERTALVQVRVTPAEAKRYRVAAAVAGMQLAPWLRSLAEEAARKLVG